MLTLVVIITAVFVVLVVAPALYLWMDLLACWLGSPAPRDAPRATGEAAGAETIPLSQRWATLARTEGHP